MKKQTPAEATNSFSSIVNTLISGSDPIASPDELDRSNVTMPLTLNWMRLMYLYKTHGVLQTAVEVPVLDALRGEVEIIPGELDADDVEALTDLAEMTGAWEAITEAMTWARLFGGSAIIINTQQVPDMPLSENQLTGKLEFYPCSRWELTSEGGYKPSGSVLDAYAVGRFANFKDEFFWFYGRKIHRSRVILLSGKKAPYILRWQLQGWGMSEIEKMSESFNLYLRTKSVIYELLREAKIDTYKIKGLYAAMASSGGQNATVERVRLMNSVKSYLNAILMDSEDDYQQKQITYSGLAEVMKMNQVCLAADLRIPMTKLFGLSATGFNSGEDDIENYNAMVESEVRGKLRAPIRKILDLLCIALWGYKPKYKFKFHPLRVLSAKDEEEIKKSKHERYLSLYQAALLSSKEFAEIEEKENMIPIETEASKGLLEDHPLPPQPEPPPGEKKPGGAND